MSFSNKENEMQAVDTTPDNAEAIKNAQQTGYWQIPNAYVKKIRKLTTNELRAELLRTAAALVDQRNANYILLERSKKIEEELKATQPIKATEGTNV